MNDSLVIDVEEPQPDPQPESQPEPPKDEGHPIWAYVFMFQYQLSLFHNGNLGFSSWKSLVFTIMLVSAVLSMVMYSSILYGTVKSVAYTDIGNVLQGKGQNGAPIYTLPTENNHTESPSGNYHFDGFGKECATDVSVKVNFFV